MPISTMVHSFSPWVGTLEPTALSEEKKKKKGKKTPQALTVCLQKAWLPHQQPESRSMLCKQESSGTLVPHHRAKHQFTELCLFYCNDL